MFFDDPFEIPMPGKLPCPIPAAVLLGCQECHHVWIQTRAFALAHATEIARCPRCKEPLRFCDAEPEPDIIVETQHGRIGI